VKIRKLDGAVEHKVWLCRQLLCMQKELAGKQEDYQGAEGLLPRRYGLRFVYQNLKFKPGHNSRPR
jgi:hypothetical protein